MPFVTVKSVTGSEIRVFAGFVYDAKYDWGTKKATKDCPQCRYCVSREDSLRTIKEVNVNKGRCRWSPPPEEVVIGVCAWGVCPKIVCIVDKPRKCEYIGKTSPNEYRRHY